MKLNQLPSVSYLNECFTLVDGALYWKDRPVSHFPQKGRIPSEQIAYMWNAKNSGNRAGRVMCGKFPYRQVGINGKRFLEHRVIAAMSGISTSEVIDHIDGNGLNNNPANLRAVSPQQNSMNNAGWGRKPGYPGVYQVKRQNGAVRWIALLRISGKTRSVGTFVTYEEAKAARVAAEALQRGQYGLYASRFSDRVPA